PARHRGLRSFPTRRSSDLLDEVARVRQIIEGFDAWQLALGGLADQPAEESGEADDEVTSPLLPRGASAQRLLAGLTRLAEKVSRSEEHTFELQSRRDLVCR